MMKKFVVFLAVVCLLAYAASAANENAKGKGLDKEDKGNSSMGEDKGKPENKSNQSKGKGGNETDMGKGKDENKSKGGQGPVQAIKAVNASMQKGNPSNQSIQARTRVMEQLRERIQIKESEVENETNNNRDKTKQFKNQNVVRERVMALHQLRNMTDDPGIGQQVAEVARQYSNSVNKTQKAEEKMMKRNWFSRMLFGGDEKAADEIEGEVNQNQQRIQQLKQLREMTNEEVQAFMQEQIQNLELEQNRLRQLAQKEKKSKGLLGWLFK
jgi:hypothetical protein